MNDVKVALPLIQAVRGGAVPTFTHQYKVYKCSFNQISEIFKNHHYKGDHMGGGIDFCLALSDGVTVVGGVVVGKPRHTEKYKGMVEIRRMALTDNIPNLASYFLSKVIWFIKKQTDYKGILSYADQSVGHSGTIYKAANFKLAGTTAPSKHVFWQGKRYHPRSLTIDRPYSYKLREAVENGEASVETGEPKLIFVYYLKYT